jgi:hypothetical protein
MHTNQARVKNLMSSGKALIFPSLHLILHAYTDVCDLSPHRLPSASLHLIPCPFGFSAVVSYFHLVSVSPSFLSAFFLSTLLFK